MQINVIIALAILLSSSMALAQNAMLQACFGDDSKLIAKSPEVGSEYQALNFWDKIWLSRAYYTDPKAICKYDFAYSFDSNSFSNEVKSQQLFELAIKGNIVVGIPNDPKIGVSSGIKTFNFSDIQSSVNVTDATSFRKYLTSNAMVVMSSSEKVLDEKADNMFAKNWLQLKKQ